MTRGHFAELSQHNPGTWGSGAPGRRSRRCPSQVVGAFAGREFATVRIALATIPHVHQRKRFAVQVPFLADTSLEEVQFA